MRRSIWQMWVGTTPISFAKAAWLTEWPFLHLRRGCVSFMDAISHKVKITASDFFTRGSWNELRSCEKIPDMVEKQHRPTFIRQWRKHRDLTLEQLSSRLDDMAPSNLSMLERGLRGYTRRRLWSGLPRRSRPTQLLC